MKKIIISGFGGQGVLSLGKFISYSAIAQGLNTSWLPSYGPEMRGGTANCSVIYSEGEIAAPVIDYPDVLFAFNEPSLVKFGKKVAPGGIIIVNSNIVKLNCERTDVRFFKVPVDEMAEKINKRGGNIIMLGLLLSILGDLKEESAIKAIKQVFENKPEVIEPNLVCLRAGIEYAKGMMA
ncbi:MAG: 2-oxoacid:acceptor oxidoreductase family protein [Firmicutes bacterium]|nr:2-oxoacid:acceptor oxidoreductase family protein [Bacillota bacterium]